MVEASLIETQQRRAGISDILTAYQQRQCGLRG